MTAYPAPPSGTANSTGRSGPLRRVLVSLMMILFVASGVFFCRTSVRQWMTELGTRRWPQVQCTVIKSAVIPRGQGSGPYDLDLRFSYRWAGQTFTSAHYTLEHQPSYDYAVQERIALRYPTGATATCWVDPADPSRAVLAHDPPTSWAAFPLGLLFILAGISPVWRWWRRRNSPSDAAGQPGRNVPSSRNSSRSGHLGIAIICAAILIAGMAILYTGARRALHARDARASCAVPCTILSSTAAEHPASGDDGPTYSVDVLYEYETAGQKYRSNQFNFADHDSSRQNAEFLLAARYPAGRPAVCYVNPADPTDAVLEPNLGGQSGLAIIPIVFILIGAGGLTAIRHSRQRVSTAGTFASASTASSLAGSGDAR